jgi:hypothetical protein
LFCTQSSGSSKSGQLSQMSQLPAQIGTGYMGPAGSGGQMGDNLMGKGGQMEQIGGRSQNGCAGGQMANSGQMVIHYTLMVPCI